MMLCLACGHTKRFIESTHRIDRYTEDCVYDGETEEIIDYDDWEDGDSDTTSSEPFRCDACDSEHVQRGLTAHSRLVLQAQHTDTTGAWSPDELPERDQHPDLVARAVASALEAP